MKELMKVFPVHLREFIEKSFSQSCPPEEIRMRVGQPLLLDTGKGEFFWDKQGGGLKKNLEGAYVVTEKDIQEVVTYMSKYSLYAFEEELRAGFLTIRGGHRVGIAGKTICEKGRIHTIRPIAFLNIRIAREQKGCADEVLPFIRHGQTIYNTLIISPPGIGKTTLLRDCIRQLSTGSKTYPGLKVAVVDERSEIAACYLGKPQNDLGPRTDVMDGCPKSEGMLLLLRAMSPQIIGVDELGGQGDYEAVEYAFHCGCQLLGTIHGAGMEEMKEKPHLSKWLEHGFFERYVFLHRKEGKKRGFHIFNEKLEQIC